MNQILESQNEKGMLSLLRARRIVYQDAKRYQGVAVILILLLPVVSLAAVAWAPGTKAFIAAAPLRLGVVGGAAVAAPFLDYS